MKKIVALLTLTASALMADNSQEIQKLIQSDDCPVYNIIDNKRTKVFRACKDTYVFSFDEFKNLVNAELVLSSGEKIKLYARH
jgi:hypothetical protein